MMEHTSVATNLIIVFLHKHPILGAACSVILAIYGTIIPNLLIDVQIPIIWMQVIQIAVWVLAGTASILTMIAIRKKIK